ncbi:MAG: potassium transporter TrkG [Clostridium fessum]
MQCAVLCGNALQAQDAAFRSVRLSTTGYATVDFDKWPQLSRTLWYFDVYGTCAGSTGGGIKVSRVLILLKSVKGTETNLHRSAVEDQNGWKDRGA